MVNRSEITAQPSLFDGPAPAVSLEQVLLYALGEFQSRGHALVNRELAMDRLHGAILRACAKFGYLTVTDDAVAAELRNLGAIVQQLPTYVAKRPYRIIVPDNLSEAARLMFLRGRG